MSAEFEGYSEKKGVWFWIELMVATIVSENPKLSATKTDALVQDFLESSFYNYLLEAPTTGKQHLLFPKH